MTHHPGARAVTVNFVKPDGRFLPELIQPALPANDNGVLVARPLDMARMKTVALFSRRELRDYIDVAIFAEQEPLILLQAVDPIRQSR